jgi:hypothetical protein
VIILMLAFDSLALRRMRGLPAGAFSPEEVAGGVTDHVDA